MLHWEHEPVALTPDKTHGETDCYSGCSYIHNGKIELFYTSVGKENRCQHDGSQQWVAVTGDGKHWEQIEENPVMRIEPEYNGGRKLTEWRDPFVFRWKGKTYALVAGVVDNKYSAVHIYTSEDMRKWTYVNEFFRNNCAEEVIECPNVVVFGDKVLFIHSYWDIRVLHYYVGTINDAMQLETYHKGEVDYGNFFASQISFDDAGRTFLWGWLREEEKVQLKDFTGEKVFQTKSGTVEIKAIIKGDGVFAFRLLDSGDGREYTDIIFNPAEGIYYAPMEESSLMKEVDKRPLFGTFPKSENHETVIDILLDNSVAEVFIGDRSTMSLRIYPTLEGQGIRFLAKDKIEEADISVYRIAL